MQRSANPFTPTFGKVPFALAGRTEYIDDVIGGLAGQPGDPYRSVVLYGPRGSGKTVLMETIAREASALGWISVNVTSRQGLLELVLWEIKRKAAHLIPPKGGSRLTSITAGPIGFTWEISKELVSQRIQLIEMVEQLNDLGVGALFAIDEADPGNEEFQVFVDTYQALVREDRDVALIIGGLPERVSTLLADKNISFIRRAFQRKLGAIPRTDVEQALLDTIEGNGRHIDPEALARCADATGGYAYAIQLVGYYLWRDSPEDRDFQPEDAELAIKLMLHEMEYSVFTPTLRSLTQREEAYLYAMAQDAGSSSTSDVAKRLGVSMSNASNIRRRLIEQGIIAEVRMGVVEFDIPLLKDYLQSRL